ncbi:LysM domain-containing protein [Microbacterium sp. AZCO]|uniref:LysM peptidoglycan-binding domain-containing protein n=1 Tax=Microbacterium sp. AZCO TaxID=3142976 RepID=UPI0031F3AB22
MNLAGKVTLGASVVVIGGLVALAAPAIAAIGQAAAPIIETAQRASAAPTTDAEPAHETAWDAEDHGTANAAPEDALTRRAHEVGCDAFVHVGNYDTRTGVVGAKRADPRPDMGPREFAAGPVTLNDDGSVATYTVQPGDAGMAIGERFCVDYVTLFDANGKWPPAATIQPGDVLQINP